jgi:serine O-acetyltransferase
VKGHVTPDWPDEPSMWQLIRADIEVTTHQNFRKFSNRYFWMRAVAKFLLSPNVRVVVLFRISHALARRGWLPLAFVLRTRGIKISGAELHPLAIVGPGLYLAHGIGSGIGAYCRIGKNCRLHLGSVIGPQPMGAEAPKYVTIGDNVQIGTHAVVIGGVTIGDGAIIGANAIVVRDVEPYTVVSASPARVVGTRTLPSPVNEPDLQANPGDMTGEAGQREASTAI